MSSRAIGAKTWTIPEAYIPAWSNGPEPEFTSHETACMLNVSDDDAHVEIRIFIKDREPVGPYRTLRQRLNDFAVPEPIPRGTDYASVIVSDVAIVAQHTRLDSRQDNALITTIAYSAKQ